MEFRVHGRVRNFCPHISFVMVGAARAVCRLGDDENVGMRESSFLELNNDEFRRNCPKNLIACNHSEKFPFFRSKTRQRRSGRSVGRCPGSNASETSGYVGLHVIVIKYLGRPYSRAIARASWYCPFIYRTLPVKDADRITRRPSCRASKSSRFTASPNASYNSARMALWLFRT